MKVTSGHRFHCVLWGCLCSSWTVHPRRVLQLRGHEAGVGAVDAPAEKRSSHQHSRDLVQPCHRAWEAVSGGGAPGSSGRDQASSRGTSVKTLVLILARQSGQLPAQRHSKPPFLPLPRRDGAPCLATRAPAALWSSWRKGVWLLWGLEETRDRTHVREASLERKGLEEWSGAVRERERMPLP